MTKKLTALAALVLLLLTQRPHAQESGPQARIYFVDVGQGASTLIVSPTGKTLLVDGGAGGGGTKVAALLNSLGIPTIDFTVVTHYHIDHVTGITELLNAGRVAGTAFDNGDDASVQPPGTSTSPTSTRGTYLNYVTATGRPGVARATIQPGQAIDLGGGMRATSIVAGGRLLGGGVAAITNQDLNTQSISLLVEYNNFDYVVSGDLTGGGSTSTAKTPDIETYVGQIVGDVDVVQLNHHGSTTTSNQVFLSAVKAEVAVAQSGETNTFGHPNRETVNKYLNTPVTSGNTFAGTGVSPAVGTGPVFYQNEASPSGDDRVTQQGYTAAAAGHAGQGTLLLATDGSTNYSLSSFDDAGAQLSGALHTYPVDGASAGVTADFLPTVIAQTSPVLPLATESVTVTAAVNDRESPISSAILSYALNGTAQSPITMALAAATYQATLPAQPDGVRVDYAITATAGGQTTTSASGYFSGVAPIASVRALNAKGEPLYAGHAARIRGTVTASGFSPGTNDDYVQDATGAVNVYRSTDTPTVFTPTAPGHIVEALGRIGFLGGRLRLDLTESVEKASSPYGVTIMSPGPAPAPVTTTIAALNSTPESFEGQFVSIANVSIVSGSIPATPQPFDTFVTVTDGTGSFSLKIDDDTDIEGFTPAATFTAVGIIQQDDFLRPFDAGYDITPRSRVDLGAAAPTPAPLLTIADARVDQVNNVDGTTGSDFIPDRVNQVVRIQGTVSSIDFRGGNGIEYYIQDGAAGIDLFSTTLNAGPFAIGDTVEAVGGVTQFNGLTEVAVTSVTLLSHGSAPAAQPITLAQLGDGGAGEALEGQLVTVGNVHVVSGAFPTAGASGNVTVSDGTANVVLRVDGDTDIDGTATPAGNFSVTALVGQFDVAPFDSGYQLLPRGLADIVAAAPTVTATPATVNFGGVTVSSAATQSVTITNTNPFSVTLAPLTVTGSDAAQFSAGTPGATTLAGGASTTVSVTFTPASPGAKSAVLNISSDGGSAVVGLTGVGQVETGVGTPIVVSELRTRGAGGGNDEFIELYNNSDTPIAIGGYKLRGSNLAGTIAERATVLAGTILPARGHFLFVNGAAAAGLVALANQTYSTGITDEGGIAITLGDNTILDQVGMSAAAAAAFREGSPLAPVNPNPANLSYERKPGGVDGSQVDTNSNAADFRSGASDPQNLASTITPGIGASPTAVNFGTIAVGLTNTATVTITNNTSAPVDLTLPFAVGGADASSFSVGTPGATTLAAGAATTVTVTFQPATGGPKNASLLVTSTAGSRSIALSGSGSGGITLSVSDINFGTVTIGALVSTTITITNTDPSVVTLSPPFAVSGANAGDFSVGLPTATSLASGASAGVTVRFQPTSAGPKSALLTISSANGGSRAVTLSGGSACQVITIAGVLPGGAVGVPYSRLLTASGGVAPYAFSIAGGTLPGGLTLAAGGLLSGTPSAAGSFTFTVQATAANSCSGIASYTVAIAASTLTASPTSVTFGSVAVGGAGSRTVTLTNNSAAPIALSPITVEGADADQFAVGAPAETVLAPGGHTTLSVSFLPTSGGTKTATLDITSTGGGSAPVTVTGRAQTIVSLGTPVVISELRTRGPNGANDELVEMYNNTNAAVVIGGYTLRGSNSAGTASIRATVPAGTILPSRSHYLFVNAAAGAPNVALANQTYSVGITDDGGIALAHPDTTIADQAGMSAGSAYKEGTTLAPLTTAGLNRSYERKLGGFDGSQIDTNDNGSDFQLITPSAPQNLASAITPATSVAPAPVNFGNTAVGVTGSVTITITNNATTEVTLTPPFAIVGAGASAFSVSAPGESTLAGGSSTTVTVTFHPATAAAFVATLAITSANGGSPAIALSGAGTPGISVTPTAIDFGTAALGSVSSATVTITNNDPTPVTLTPPFAIDGANADELTVAAPSATTIAPGDAATVAVAFQPATLGSKSAMLTISSVAGGMRTVSLSGHAVCAPIAIGGTLPDGEVGVAYAQTLAASGATGPYLFSIAAGTLPAGLDLDAAGALAGTPTAPGASPFTVRATAGNGCSGTADFVVTIRDTLPPSLTLPAHITIEATGATTPVTFSVTASDVADPAPVVNCSPASGFAFPVAATTVNCTATDANGNSASGSFMVTVTDLTAPALTLPGTLTATATSPSGAVVTYSAAASDLVDGARTVACTPASGSTFAIGTTLVSCSTRDAHGNSATGSFNVTVTAAAQPGRMIGDGKIEVGVVTHAFAFFVQERASGADVSAIRYRVKTSRRGRDQEDRFDAIAVTGVTFFNVPGVSPGPQPPSGVDTVTFGGTGRWNGRSGYTFEARAIDAGEPGRGHDAFAITVRDAGGQIVASVDATIGGGNIQSLRIRR